jgi:N-acetylmuramoyl-L-alanine amidase
MWRTALSTRIPTSVTLAILLLAGARGAAAQSPIVMIDPGHGGEQAGVRAGEVLEKDLVLRAAFALGEAFVARGYDVRLTRTGDYAVPNPERRRAAEAAGAALMISLHFNQNADSTRHGIEIYGNLDDDRVTDLGNRLATELRSAGTPVTVAPRAGEFLTSPTVPTVMIEAGFLTHPVEHRLVTSSSYHHELAALIVRATAAFLTGAP